MAMKEISVASVKASAAASEIVKLIESVKWQMKKKAYEKYRRRGS
jgi:hypothetical protein